MLRNRIRQGDHLFVCDRSGHVHYASEGKLEWDGLFVYKRYYKPRQPQDFVKGRLDHQTVAISRPLTDPDFIPDSNPVTWDDL